MHKLYTEKDALIPEAKVDEYEQLVAMVNKPEEITVDDLVTEEVPVLSAAEQLKQFTDSLPKTLAELQRVNVGIRPFTTAKCKVQYDITNTSIYPTRLTMASGDFAKAYRKQLDDLIFDFENEVNPTKLVGLLVVVEQVESGAKTVRIRAPGYSKMLPKIVSTLNDFYFTNGQILKGILDMFKGQGQQALAKDKMND